MEKPPCQKDLACSSTCAPSARLDASSLVVLDHMFTYHAPTPAQVDAMAEIRSKARDLAVAIRIHAPKSADASAAMRKVREAVMTANAAIVLDGVSL